MPVIGVRREDKSVWEKRTPLVPHDVAALVRDHGIELHVQPSETRCFPDREFAEAGARIVPDLTAADVILGVKEIPLDAFEAGKAYFFFSHTMKGQPWNMPMLRRLLDLGCTLLDYELVTDAEGIRTIAFGRHAGLAGAIDTLWALGRRWLDRGLDTPLASLDQAVVYGELDAARGAIEEAGRRVAAEGLPAEISPLAIGVTGEGGKVWGGAMEVMDLLGAKRVPPAEIAGAVAERRGEGREILVASYGPGDLVEPVTAGHDYTWDDYVSHPERYRARFGAALEHLSAVVHGIYWEEGYPRFVLREDLRRLWAGADRPRLELVADITCDLGGSNESLLRTTDPGDPAYLYDPEENVARPGWNGPGPAVLAVEILPAEIPRDASRHFSRALAPLVPALASRGRDLDPTDDSLPAPLRGSFLVTRGELLPRWRDELAEPLAEHGAEGAAR